MRSLMPATVLLSLLAACDTKWSGVDADGDGFSPADGDCWDRTEGPPGSTLGGAQIHPGAEDVPYDGVDADCGGDDDFDADRDGFVPDEYLGAVTQGAPDAVASQTGGDCDDEDAAIHPDAAEICDERDNNCDALIDDDDPSVDLSGEATFYADADGDSWGDPDATVVACALPDGFSERADDCDDTRDDVNPDGQEVCGDETDEDCDGLINDDDDSVDPSSAPVWYTDADDDEFGVDGAAVESCSEPADGDYSLNTDDCDDARADVNPDAPEVCDGGLTDEDCDGLIDDEDDDIAAGDIGVTGASSWYGDADGDTYGDPAVEQKACAQPAGFVADNGDCDDDASSCNVDCSSEEDLDGVPDCLDACLDPDQDDYGVTDASAAACVDATGAPCVEDAACLGTDCDQGNASINPGAQEVCDSRDTDEDCDGLADDDDGSVDASGFSRFYDDDDGDTYGDPAVSTQACDAPAGFVTNDDDCDDTDGDINPAAQEVCDAADTDEDCDGDADDDDSSVATSGYATFYLDDDADNYGDPASTTQACDAPSRYVTNDDDCDDTDGTINPAAQEVCDAADTDEDCDGDADDDDSSVAASGYTTFYLDDDTDTYGDPASTTQACDVPGGYVTNDDDCDDSTSAISPAAQEVCDAADTDEDCDGDADDDDSSVDASGYATFYDDDDGDTYGDPSVSTQACDAPTGFVTNDDDCDDTEATVNPGADEVCNDTLDNDCDGTLGSRATGAALPECAYSDETVGVAHATYSSSSASSHLGWSVRIVGDLDGDGVADVAAGAPVDDSGATNGGEVWVLTDLDSLTTDYDASISIGNALVGTAWTGGGSGDLAGWALAGGDIDTDAQAELFVGAPSTNNSGPDRGAVYLLTGAAGWTTGGALIDDAEVAYGLANADELGFSLSADGDVDIDGKADLLVGAPGGDYAVLLTSTTYQATGGLTNPLSTGNEINADVVFTGTAGDRAGAAVDLADLDGDGVFDAIIGAPDATVGSTSAGQAHLVEAPSADVTLSSTHTLDGPTANVAGFGGDAGYTVASADVNGDGSEDAIIGARGARFARGDVYVILGGSTIFSGSTTLTADATLEGDTSDQAGTSVANAGDIDDDGSDEILIGAPGASSGTGAVYLVYGGSTGTITLATSTSVVALTGDASGGGAGIGVHGGGDVNYDGVDDFIVGAPYAGTGSTAGAAYLFLGLTQ